MRKLILITALAVFGFNLSNAQDVSFGVKGGVNLATFTGDDSAEAKGITSYHVGGLVDIEITEKFSVQPEVIYSVQGADSDLGDFRLDYINVPVLAKFMIVDGLSLEGGPQIGFLTSSKLENEDIKDFVKKTDFGAVLGLGYLLDGGLNFAARYNFGLSNISDSDLDVDVKNGVFQLSIGYMF
ncbi:porin family protein [Gelidibacter japonicus]|uniref:porin family protein n=1 Tax=Gelidibacter japonicus TaxID=1962232 RepID=UPI003A93F50D